MSENNPQNMKINKKPWMKHLLYFFETIIEFNNKIEAIKENLCNISNFNPIKLFIYLDFEKNGFLTSKNIIYFLEQNKTKIEEQYIRSLIHTFDKDGDYNLNFSEFLNVILPVKNKSLKEKILLVLKEKSEKKIISVIPKEINILFNELIKEELYFAKTSLLTIKRIYDSREFTTYDVFIDIVKNDSYITKENLSEFLKENNFQINSDLDIKNIMFRIDADNDNKISYPEFQDIFYPLKNLEMNYSKNKETYNNKKEKEKDALEEKIEMKYGSKLNYNYNIYRYDLYQPNKKYQILNNNGDYKNISENKNKELSSSYYKNFINTINKNLENIQQNKNANTNNSHIQEKQKIKEIKEIKIEEEKNNSKEKLKNQDININIKKNIDIEQKKEKKDSLTIIKNRNIEKSLTYGIELSANISIEKSAKIKQEIKDEKNKKEIKGENKIIFIENQKNLLSNNVNDKDIFKNINISKKKEESKEINNLKENFNNKENNPNYNNIKLYEDNIINEIYISKKEENKMEKINHFNDLKTQNCFRFSINKKEKKKFLIRNFSDIQHKHDKNKEYTLITKRILNNSQNNIISENRNNSVRKINKYKLNFNSLNLYNKPKNNRSAKIISPKTNHEYDLTNYFRFKNSITDSNSNIINNDKNESKTSRITNTNIKIKNKALFVLLNNYLIQELEKEKILEELYLCSDFNLQNMFQSFLWPENSLSFKKGIITANDIYNTLLNLGLKNINQKDVIYIFIKYNKNIYKKEKINNIGFTYEEFCEMMKPKNLPKNSVDKKYQKYFMGFCFKTKRIICSLFKQIIDSEKLNEIFRRQLISNEKNKYKIYLNAVNLFNSLKYKDSDEYLDENNIECFMNVYDKRLKNFEKTIIMKRFDKNNDGIIDFNEFFNEIIPKIKN